MEFYKPARSFIIICATYTAQCHIHKQLGVSKLGVLIVQMTVRELSHAEVLLIIYIFMCMQDMNVMFITQFEKCYLSENRLLCTSVTSSSHIVQ